MKRYRYCEYLGKYFCQCCHGNHQAYIPGRILHKWDFSKGYVSNFSHDLLEKMFYDPLFNIMDINEGLYRRVRVLDQVRDWRQQLFSLKDFVRTCRHDASLHEEFDKQPSYLLNDIHMYSIHDLLRVKNGEMGIKLKKLAHDALIHVNQCQLCQMKGFICEVCRSNHIIFPYQLKTVCQCLKCWGCFHRTCFINNNKVCPKCKRIEDRKKQMENIDSSENEL